jgi:hypothetical protein
MRISSIASYLGLIFLCSDSGDLFCSGLSSAFGSGFGFGFNPPDVTAAATLSQEPGRVGDRNSRLIRNSETPVPLEAKFVQVETHQNILLALDSSGELWACGKDTPPFFSNLGISESSLPYFTKAVISSYVTADGSTEEPTGGVKVKRIVSYEQAGYVALYVLTSDDKLIMLSPGVRDFSYEDEYQWYEVAGFVDSVSVSAGGSGYTAPPTVTFSAPTGPAGVEAQAVAVLTGGAVSSVYLTSAGFNYTSAPSVTFSGGGGTGATASASLFETGWKDIFPGPAAIDADGRAYFWRGPHPQTVPDTGSLIASLTPVRPAGQGTGAYKKISSGHGETDSSAARTTLLLKENGSLQFYGNSPTEEIKYDITDATFAGTMEFIDIASASRAVACVNTEGDIYTYGIPFLCGRGESESFLGWGIVEGGAKWSAVFAGRDFAFWANRVESFDERGNRIDPLAPGFA